MELAFSISWFIGFIILPLVLFLYHKSTQIVLPKQFLKCLKTMIMRPWSLLNFCSASNIFICGVSSWQSLFIHPALNSVLAVMWCSEQNSSSAAFSIIISPFYMILFYAFLPLKILLHSFLGVHVMLLACTDLAFGQNLFIFFTWTGFMPGSNHPKHLQLKFQNFILIPVEFHPVSFSPLVLPMENFLIFALLSKIVY